MKRIALLFLCIILALMLTACSSQGCTCVCCTTETGCGTINETSESNVNILQESENMNEEIEIEDSCENPIGYSHYPYVTIIRHKKGSVGTVSITTVEHGFCFDGFFNGFGTYIGTGILENQECYSTAEKATENPIVIESRGHEIIITMSYGQNTESFTMNAGDSQILSIQELSYLTNRAYVYVIVI